ncbi:MAG TPA: tyrosine-type recombinase/integrase, partial [Bacillota bacterium]|nr:tyrosine-type recombinase/integrase [Bacillota bacterium]
CKHKKLSQMSTLDWQEIINTARPIKRKYKTKTITLTQTQSGRLSEKTLKNIRDVIRGFIKWCRKGDLTTLNPELTIPRGREKVTKNVLTTEEANALVRTRISNNSMLHAFRLQIALGLRPGEVLGLKMSDIDGKMMHIQRSLNDKGEITGGKNFNANQQEYLFPLAYEIVQDQIKYRKQQKATSDKGWLFPQADGSITSHAIYRRKLTGYCNDVGCTPITPYRLRHSFISVMAVRVDLDKIKLIVGHSDSMDTLRTYDQKLEDNIRLAGTIIGEVWDAVQKA